MDDKTQFDGADRVKLRDHFNQLVKGELERNLARQPVADFMEKQVVGAPTEPLVRMGTFGPRYSIFGVVDDICIESMHREQPGPLLMLVRRDWEPMTAEEEIAEHGEFHPDYEEGWIVDHTEGPGSWIYTQVNAYTENYSRLGDVPFEWGDRTMFLYPSMVYGTGQGMSLERSPGFWREEMAAKRS